jgi:hypothetical protein
MRSLQQQQLQQLGSEKNVVVGGAVRLSIRPLHPVMMGMTEST